MPRQITGRDFVGNHVCFIDRNDHDLLGAGQEWCGVAHGPRGEAAAIPADSDPFRLERSMESVGQESTGPPAWNRVSRGTSLSSEPCAESGWSTMLRSRSRAISPSKPPASPALPPPGCTG